MNFFLFIINFEIVNFLNLSSNINIITNQVIDMIKQKKELKPIPPSKHTFVVLATSDCLKCDKNKINFCKYPIFGSSSKQITIVLQLMDYFIEYQKKDFHMLKLKAVTTQVQGVELSNKNVFTVKAVQNGQESTQIQIPIKASQSMQVFIKATIPQLQVSTDILGELQLQIDEFTPMVIPISSRGEVPQIVCMKEMENLTTRQKIIKIPSKNIMKIPFKNCSNINFFFEIKLLGKDGQKTESDGVKLKVIPNQPINMNKFQDQKNKKDSVILKVDANSAFCVTLEFQLLKKQPIIRVARRLLILQVQGTKLNFPFPLEVIISE